MKAAGIRSCVGKRYRVCTTDSNHGFRIAANLLNRNFSTDRLGKAWVSDITYVRTAQGWLYLTTVIDLADRMVIGWALSYSMQATSASGGWPLGKWPWRPDPWALNWYSTLTEVSNMLVLSSLNFWKHTRRWNRAWAAKETVGIMPWPKASLKPWNLNVQTDKNSTHVKKLKWQSSST